MPLYSYVCENCGLEDERIVYIANRDEQRCSQCTTLLTRKIDRPGLVWSPTASRKYS